ncbi:siderophore-interacting protein [Sinosporangium siamense]|uniref:Siderophore-interacting FAD-binding domain-containing protein n=1 Tax=Sinosporangium siamense TaxID=1367973 RepID=A0A919VGB6_9ACTN|nr:siderophore-interacting protein [Sinosporangium siamense]GII96949.1 hypothetical protein Ssi02_71800 [Sinosporangium siamense]
MKDPLSVAGILRPSDTLRIYTIWDLDPTRTAIELRVHLYPGDGIGLRWARAVRPGDRVIFWWPQGDFFTREAAYHVVIGEETAGAAFGPMIRGLGASAEVFGVLPDGPVGDDRLHLPLQAPPDPSALIRGSCPSVQGFTSASSSPHLTATPLPPARSWHHLFLQGTFTP